MISNRFISFSIQYLTKFNIFRSEHHNHGQHKTQIMKKLKSKCLFTSITQATNRMIIKQIPKEKPKKVARNTNTSLRAKQIIKVTLPKT